MLLRRLLSPFWLRLLLLFDLFLGVFPPWAWFLYWRWTGKRLGPQEAWRRYLQALRFGESHLQHARHFATGVSALSWNAPARRHTEASERQDYGSPGSCGSCQNCCTTYWDADKARPCPFLNEQGCGIYGGLWWDHSNCGPYPKTQNQIQAYNCPRFHILPDPPQS
jgi:hypothetical protein